MESGIENILKVTGLSCDDLINKLLRYKNLKNDDLPENDNNDATNLSCLKSDKPVDNSDNNNASQSENSVEAERTLTTDGILKNGNSFTNGNYLKSEPECCSKTEDLSKIEIDLKTEDPLKTEGVSKYDNFLKPDYPSQIANDLKLNKQTNITQFENLFENDEFDENADSYKNGLDSAIINLNPVIDDVGSLSVIDSDIPLDEVVTIVDDSDNDKNKSLNLVSQVNDESSGSDNEEIKDRISKQLLLLRAKAEDQFVNKVPVRNVKKFVNKKQYVPNVILLSSSEDESPSQSDLCKDTSAPEKSFGLKNVLLNNDSDIKIVDVRSGKNAILLNLKQDVIKPTKTSDIKKIKGWKNKKFDISNSSEFNAVKNKNVDISNSSECIASSSKNAIPTKQNHFEEKFEESKPSFDYMEKSTEEDSRNPFKSQELDMFLREVVHEIPKSSFENKNFYVQPIAIISGEKPQRGVGTSRFVRKPRTVAEKRRADLLLKHGTIKTENLKRERNAFAYYNGSKLKISATVPNKYLKIEDRIQKKVKRKEVITKTSNDKYKTSILTTLTNDFLRKLRYNPGPLSKKAQLQVSHKNQYETVIKQLSPVTLEVKPSFGKRFPPSIEPYITYNTFEMSEDRISFALSAVKDHYKGDVFFKFNVPYEHQQQQIKLYKRIYLMPLTPEVVTEDNKVNKDNSSIEDIVQNVVNDMITYVQLKQISESLIQTDKDTVEENVVVDKCVDLDSKKDFSGNFEVISNKKTPKSSKTSLELKRLNVKIIEVDIEQDGENDEQNCKKPHCQLGCVCKSLRGCSHMKNHCGNIDCMIQCTCNYSKSTQLKSKSSKVVLPAGTNLLSNGTVNELENHVKRNLAPVEKEFTQTVIQSKDKTIIIGNNLERKKRVTKAPKKLQDFIHPNNSYQEYKKLFKLEDCSVKLKKYDFNHIVPFCMFHEVYDCECLFRFETISNKPTNVAKTVAMKKPTKPVHTKPKPKKIYSASYNKEKFEPAVVIDLDKIESDEKEIEDGSKKKRKQTFDYIRTSPIFIDDKPTQEPAMQRRKKVKREIIAPLTISKTSKFFNDIENNPDFVLSDTNSEFYASDLLHILTRQFGQNHTFRMVPWKVFTRNYYDNCAYIWYRTSNSGKILITQSAKAPEKDMVDLKMRKDLPVSLDFLKWLKQCELPADKNPDNLYIVLVSTKIEKCWEIFGISNISKKLTPNGNSNSKAERYFIEDAKYSAIKLYSSEEKTIDIVSLPTMKEYVKWRKMQLKSNFTFMFLHRFDLRVKYNVLLGMAKDAQNSKRTKCLYVPYNKSDKYGLYAVPECNDCVYLGPYKLHEREDFDTLRYVNRELISTDQFDKMLNNGPQSKGSWFYSSIMHTCMYKSILRNKWPTKYRIKVNGKEIDLSSITSALNKDVVLFNGNKIKVGSERRFLITNVRNLGYVDTFIMPSKQIVICWPDIRRPKLFSTEMQALQWFQL